MTNQWCLAAAFVLCCASILLALAAPRTWWRGVLAALAYAGAFTALALVALGN